MGGGRGGGGLEMYPVYLSGFLIVSLEEWRLFYGQDMGGDMARIESGQDGFG